MRGRIGLVGGLLLGLWHLVPTAGGVDPEKAPILPPAKEADQAPPTLLLSGSAARVHSVALSPDGKLLVTLLHNYKARLWEVASGREVRSFVGQDTVALSKDGKWLVTGSRDARLYELTTGKEIRVFPGSGRVGAIPCLTLSEDSQWLAFDNQVFDTATGRKVHDVWVGSEGGWTDRAAAFSSDGKHLVTGGGAWLRLWDVGTGRQTRIIRSPQSRVITTVAISKDGKLVVANDDTLARLWDVAAGKVIRTFEGHAGGITSVVLSADGKVLATAGGVDHTARLWDVATGKELRVFKVPPGNVLGARGPQAADICADLTPDGKWLATGSTDGTARVWDAATGKEVRVFQGPEPARGLAVSANGKWFLTVRGKIVLVWDLTAGKPVRRFEADPDWKSVSVSGDGKRLAALSEDGQSAQVRDGATGKLLGTFEGLTGFATLASDGTRLVTGSKDRTARLWDAAGGKEVRVFQGHTGALSFVALARDGKRLVTACAGPDSADDTIRVWELATGKEISALHEGGVKSVSVSADGKWLATARESYPPRLWDLQTGSEVRSFPGQEAWVAVAAPVDNVDRLFTIGDDGHPRVWDTATGKELCRLANLAGGHWAVCDPAGRFDASNRRDLDGLHWVAGNRTFPLGRFADRFSDPGLLGRVMGNR